MRTKMRKCACVFGIFFVCVLFFFSKFKQDHHGILDKGKTRKIGTNSAH